MSTSGSASARSVWPITENTMATTRTCRGGGVRRTQFACPATINTQWVRTSCTRGHGQARAARRMMGQCEFPCMCVPDKCGGPGPKVECTGPSLANKKEMQDPVRNRACDPASGAHRFVVVKAVCGRVVTGFVPERLRKQRFCVQENVKRIAVQRIDLLFKRLTSLV
jgi:hypothetical protein